MMWLLSGELGIEPDEIEEIDSESCGVIAGKSASSSSGGQKQRVAIAGAIAMKPECLR